MDTYILESNHITYESSYDDGQLNQITEYDMNGKVEADSIDEAIETYFEEVLFFSYDKKHAYIEDGILSYSVLVDEDQDEVKLNTHVYNAWKRGEYKLFDNEIRVRLMKEKWEKLDDK